MTKEKFIALMKDYNFTISSDLGTDYSRFKYLHVYHTSGDLLVSISEDMSYDFVVSGENFHQHFSSPIDRAIAERILMIVVKYTSTPLPER